MNTLQEKTFYQLAGTSLPNASIAELFKLADEHPYFSAAQFFLTQKLQQENHVGFVPQLQKTALYFNNPYWLEYQLQQNKADAVDIIYTTEQAETKPLLNKVVEEEIQQFSQPTASPVIEIPSMESVKDLMDNIQEPVAEPEALAIENQTPTVEAAETPEPVIVNAEPTATDENPVNTTNEEAQIIEESAALEQPISNEVVELETTTHHPAPNNPILEQYETEPNDNSTHMDAEVDISQQKLNSILSQQLENFKKPVAENVALPIESEPYHTIDYFASQGIKVNADGLAHDKLSKQLRKFTDWLKHMKQVEVDPQDLGTDPELETAIHSIANTSNEAKEIVTETMAEVLEKQGKTDKAIQLYIKLSFLNPDKSTYFAAKIQKLKGI